MDFDILKTKRPLIDGREINVRFPLPLAEFKNLKKKCCKKFKKAKRCKRCPGGKSKC